MAKVKLKPCPFCSSRKIEIVEPDAPGYCGRCMWCGSHGALMGTKTAAGNAWNRRTGEAHHDATD